MKLFNKRERNASKYLDFRWEQSEEFRLKALKETIDIWNRDIVKNGIDVIYHGHKLHFDGFNKDDLVVNIELEHFGDESVSAGYTHATNTIDLNDDYFKKQPLDAYGSLAHEHSHRVIKEMVKQVDQYDKNSIEYEFLRLLKNQTSHLPIERSLFGITAKGETYIRPNLFCDLYNEVTNQKDDYKLDELSDLNRAFYEIQLCERIAFTTGENAFNYLVSVAQKHDVFIEDLNQYTSEQKSAAGRIRSAYNAYGLTYEDIYKLIDKVFLDLLENHPPDKRHDVEANMLYDFATIWAFQAASREQINKELLHNGLFAETFDGNKMNAIKTYYRNQGLTFSIADISGRLGDEIFPNDYKPTKSVDVKTLQNMSEVLQNENPRILLDALFAFGSEAKPAIHNINVFLDWFYLHIEAQRIQGTDPMIINFRRDIVETAIGQQDLEIYKKYARDRDLVPEKNIDNTYIEVLLGNKEYTKSAFKYGEIESPKPIKPWEPITKRAKNKLQTRNNDIDR